ncbi:MAG: SIMPL domain-containing protein, partial [Flavobacteriales bacterium]|nr:SIMPL domain-containing protein [Flavobacteriales bacterium]
ANDIIFKSIDINKDYYYKSKFNLEGDKVDSEKIFSGYVLKQEVEISSNQVDLIEQISNEVTDLIENNIFITSYAPRYYYTKLGELKIEMIESAAQDGLLRAKTAIEGGGGDLGELLETRIGVFQILGKNSNDEFSWGGTLNTLNKEKTAFVNVKQRFEID